MGQDSAANGTVSQVTSSLPNGFRYALQMQRTASSSSTNTLRLVTVLETQESMRFAGQSVTLSFYAKAGANYSATSNNLVVYLGTGTGTDQTAATFVGSGFTGNSFPISGQNAALTTSWQRFTYTGTIGSTVTQLGLQLLFYPTGTAGANDWFQITGMQLELGSTATAFSRAGGTLQGELAACQRYYYRFSNAGTTPSYIGIGTYFSTTTCYIVPQWPVQMRVAPTLTTGSGTAWVAQVAGTARTSSAFASDIISTNYADVYITTAADTAGRSAIVGLATGTANYLEASAEL
jgi:hypothetical protein